MKRSVRLVALCLALALATGFALAPEQSVPPVQDLIAADNPVLPPPLPPSPPPPEVA